MTQVDFKFSLEQTVYFVFNNKYVLEAKIKTREYKESAKWVETAFEKSSIKYGLYLKDERVLRFCVPELALFANKQDCVDAYPELHLNTEHTFESEISEMGIQ